MELTRVEFKVLLGHQEKSLVASGSCNLQTHVTCLTFSCRTCQMGMCVAPSQCSCEIQGLDKQGAH